MMSILELHNLAAIANDYDAFLVDLWGVIHDGIEPYDGVNDCLGQLKQAGKKVVFVSNAPRRAQNAIAKLEEFNITPALYDHIVTSGDITRDYVASGSHGYGNRYYMIGPARDDGLLDGLDFTRSHTPEQADFVIVTGFDHDDSTLDDVVPQLDDCLERNLPMICANPDMVVVRKNGKRALCAGKIADHYEYIGGKTHYFGKPYSEVYHKALSYLGDVFISRIAAIGDNLETDIKGANARGIASYLIPGGILGEHLGIDHGQLPTQEKLQSLCDAYHIKPIGVLGAFVW